MHEITILLNKPLLSYNDKQHLCELYKSFYNVHILPHNIDDYFLTFNIMRKKTIFIINLNHLTFFTFGIFGDIIDNIYYTCKDINKQNLYLTKIYDSNYININNLKAANSVKDSLTRIHDKLDPFLNNKFKETDEAKAKLKDIINQINTLISH